MLNVMASNVGWFIRAAMGLSILFAIYMLSGIDWSLAWYTASSLSPLLLLTAFTATAASYIGLAGYDVVAIRNLSGIPVSAGRAAIYGATAYGISNFLGFPWLVGGIVRQTLYDLPARQMGALATLVTSGWVAFWLVVALTCGLGMVVTGTGFGAVAEGISRIFGAAIIGLAAVAFAALGDGRHFCIRRQEVQLLSRRLTSWQMGCALIDLAASAVVLYVLLPSDLHGSYLSFLALFCMAVGFGIVSHMPAGIGSFELVIALGLHAVGRPDVGVSLLMYRMMRTVMPFIVACGAFIVMRHGPATRIVAE